MRVIVFGCGQVFEKYKYRLKDFEIVAILDNDKQKQGKYKDGAYIDKPENYYHYAFDAVVIMCADFDGVRKQLIELGIPQMKIIDADHKGPFENCTFRSEYIVNSIDYDKPKILLFSREMTNTGAAIVLLKLARIIQDEGYQVDVITCNNGPLVFDYLLLRINVYYFAWDDMIPMDFWNRYNLILINTVLLYRIVKSISSLKVPVLWWWHEDKTFCDELCITSNEIVMGDNIHPLAVSNRVVNAYVELTGKKNIKELCFGIEEMPSKKIKKTYKKTICAIIGEVSRIKGHDVLLESIKKNAEIWKEQIEFWLIGSYAERDKESFGDFEFVKFRGIVAHESLLEMYGEIDIVLCASRFESMSAAIIEGMMNRKLCIMTKDTGIADYCVSYKDAIIIDSGQADSLSDALNWVLSHKNEWNKIAENGHVIYRQNFSITSFKERVKRLLNEYIC